MTPPSRLAVVFALLSLLAAGGCRRGTSARNRIRFGFFGPLTGPTAQAGQALYQGAQLGVKEINEAGGVLGRRIELIPCDDKSSNDEGVKCAMRLIGRYDVFAAIGTLHSPILAAAGPILDRNRVPTVGAGTGVSWCQQGFRYLWRGTANSDVNARAIGKAIVRLGIKTIALLYQNDDYGKSGLASLEALGAARIAAAETFKPGDRDFSGQIIKLIAARPDAIAVWALGDAVGPITNQLRQQGWSGPILGPEAFTLPEAVDLAGNNLDGAVFASVYYIPKNVSEYPVPRIAAFLARFQQNFGHLPESDNAYRSYDGVSILAEGIRRAGALDPERVRQAVSAMSDFEGLAGKFDFRGGGCEGIRESRLWTYRNRRITPFTVD